MISGTTGEQLVDRELSTAKKHLFAKGANAIKALAHHKIDMFIYDAPFIHWTANDDIDYNLAALSFASLSEELIAWGVRKNDKELFKGANKFLQEWEDSGKLEDVILKWISK